MNTFNHYRDPLNLSNLDVFKSTVSANLDRRNTEIKPILGCSDKLDNTIATSLVNSAVAICAVSRIRLQVCDEDAVGFYERSTGYNSLDPATDRGTTADKALAFAFANGAKIGPHIQFPLYGTLDHRNRNDLAIAAEAFGSAFLVLNMSRGSHGGQQATLLWGYEGLSDYSTVRLINGDKLFKTSWQWIEHCVIGAYGILWPQLINPVNDMITKACVAKIRAQNISDLLSYSH
jgi:hypothetical protein